MSRILRPLLLSATAALAFSGCGLALPTLDASTPEGLRSSLNVYVNDGASATRDEREATAKYLLGEYLAGDGFNPNLGDMPPVEALHRLRFEDVPTFAERVKAFKAGDMKPLDPGTFNPDEDVQKRWLNEHILSQLKVQKSLLELNRERARHKDLFTVDQLSYREAAFIPPQDGMPFGSDVATFTVKFTNESFFNIYTVGFRVRVKEPAYSLPLIDDVLVYDADKNPIRVGETRVIQVTCCDSISSEVLNLSLRKLSPMSEIDIDLASVTDFTKTDRLAHTFFTAEQNVKLVATGVCIKDMEERMDTWTIADSDPACVKY